MTEQTIKIGRRGCAYIDNNELNLIIEVQGYERGKPLVYRAPRVYRADGYNRWSTVQRTDTERSRSGRGRDTYQIAKSGIYVVRDAHDTSERRRSHFLLFGTDGTLRELEGNGAQGDEVEQALRDQYPAQADDHDRAQRREQEIAQRQSRLEAEIEEERGYYTVTETSDGYRARPVFPDVPRDLAHKDDEDEQLVALYSLPRYYEVDRPHARGESPEAAIEEARRIDQERREAAEQAAGQAEEQGWPALTGSPKQIRWAEQIRAAYARLHPGDAKLRQVRRAKYWIDNYKHLT